MSEIKRAVVIGLDGATWRLIDPLITDNRLPFLESVKSRGVHCELISTSPPLTPPAWTTMVTGVNPGKHNVFEFFETKGGFARAVTGRDRKVKAIWEILADYGLKVIIVNVPITFPPDEIEGAMISGMDTPSRSSSFVYPEELKTITERFHYAIDFEEVNQFAGNPKLYLKKALDIEQSRISVLFELANHIAWDLIWIVFTITDRVQHIYWNSKNVLEESNWTMQSMYEELDSKIKTIVERFSPANFFIVSDHGFMYTEKCIYVSNVLRDLGLLKVRERKSYVVERNLGLNRQRIGRFLVEYGAGAVIKHIPSYISKLIPYESEFTLDRIDWNNTKAWFSSTEGKRNPTIRILSGDRNPSADHGYGDYDEICMKIVNELSMLRDRDSGGKVITKVSRSREIYHGHYLGNAPDLVVQPAEGYSLKEGFGKRTIEPLHGRIGVLKSDHAPEGIFMSWGPSIKQLGKVKPMNILDVMPTVLQLFGIPIPAYLDGRVAENCLAEEVMSRGINGSSYDGSREEKADDLWNESDERLVQDRLRNLGYL